LIIIGVHSLIGKICLEFHQDVSFGR